jgi:serine/threonine protein kinase
MRERLGKYELREKIGSGGFSTVYHAIHAQLKSDAAVKVLDARRFDNEIERARFLEEARTAGKLKHANLVEVFDLIQQEDCMAIAMEFMVEGSLRRWMQDDHSIPEKIDVMRQVAAGLDALHRKHLIHRDVKPENILIYSLQPLLVKLSDFGLVIDFNSSNPTTSQRQAISGTVYYLSPEQVRELELGPQSDQYSLACVAYELIVGQRPFDGKSPISIAIQRLEDGMPKKPSQVNEILTPAFDACFLKALSQNPDQRYENCTAFVVDLEYAWKDSQLRLFNEHLDKVDKELLQGSLAQAHQELEKAKGLFPDNPRLQEVRLKLERYETIAERFFVGLIAWRDAQQKAKAVLALNQNYPDPAGMFTLFGLKLSPPTHYRMRDSLVKFGIALLLALPASALIIFITFRLIIAISR